MDSTSLAVHKELIIVDGHCDSVLDMVGMSFTQKGKAPPRDFYADTSWCHVDLPKLQRAGVTCQTMTLFTDDPQVPFATQHAMMLSDKVDEIIGGSEDLVPAFCAGDIRKAKADGKIALMKSIEGGEAIGTDLGLLREFHRRGVRIFGLTYNRPGPIGRGLGAPGSGGLTPFGRAVVAEAAKIGMVIDVSHLSDEGLADVLKITEVPFVASHSNSRRVNGHNRNLTDEQLKAIANKGGLIGLTYPGVFVDSDPRKVSFRRLMDHLDHMLDVAGADHIGLGSDFDGYTLPYGIAMTSCLDVPKITDYLLKNGLSLEDTAKVMGKNWLRVIQEVAGA